MSIHLQLPNTKYFIIPKLRVGQNIQQLDTSEEDAVSRFEED